MSDAAPAMAAGSSRNELIASPMPGTVSTLAPATKLVMVSVASPSASAERAVAPSDIGSIFSNVRRSKCWSWRACVSSWTMITSSGSRPAAASLAAGPPPSRRTSAR